MSSDDLSRKFSVRIMLFKTMTDWATKVPRIWTIANATLVKYD